MITEEMRNSLVENLHNVDFDYNSNVLNPTIVRHMEDTNREEDFIVVEFRPTSIKHGLSINHFKSKRLNENYSNYCYGEQTMVSIVGMARTKSFVHGRTLVSEWLIRIRDHIRKYWESIEPIFILKHTFSQLIEETNFFTERQYVYRFDFMVNSNHEWNNEPEVPIPGPDLAGVEVHDTIVWVES